MNWEAQHQLIIAKNLEQVFSPKKTPNSKGLKTWFGSFDVATWLNVFTRFKGMLSLELQYKDDRGEHSVLIDRCRYTGSTVLLTNRISLNLFGAVADAQLNIHTDDKVKVGVLEVKLTPVVISVDQYLKKTA